MAGISHHSWSSIGRPLDPAISTNRAVLYLMPVSGLAVAGIRTLENGVGVGLLLELFTGAAAALGGWALVRELIPDEPMLAFGGLAGAVLVLILVPESSLMFLFSTLLLVRIVNRTVGPPARLTDCLALSILVGWTIHSTGLHGLGFAAAVAFIADATIVPRLPRQWAFGVFWLILSAAFPWPGHSEPVGTATPNNLTIWALVAVAALFSVRILYLTAVVSMSDRAGEPLFCSRIRAGMGVALLVALPTVFLELPALRQSALVWASLAAVSLSGIRALSTRGFSPDSSCG